MKASISSLEIKGKTIKKGSRVVLDFDNDGNGLNLDVNNIYMDGQTDEFGDKIIWIESSTQFGSWCTHTSTQYEESMV